MPINWWKDNSTFTKCSITQLSIKMKLGDWQVNRWRCNIGVRWFRLRNISIMCSLSNVHAIFEHFCIYIWTVFSIYINKQVNYHVRGGFKKEWIVMKVESRIIEKKRQMKVGGRSDNRKGNRRTTKQYLIQFWFCWIFLIYIWVYVHIYSYKYLCVYILCIYEFKWNYPVIEERGPFQIIHPIARKDYLNLSSSSVKLKSKL